MNTYVTTTILIVLSAGLAGIAWGLIGAAMLKVTKNKIVLTDTDDNGASDLRILYFSDLHREFCLVPSSKITDQIAGQAQGKGLDAVIFGGDISNHGKNAYKALPYLTDVADACRKYKIPFLAVTGNHDALCEPEDLGMMPFDNMDGCIKYLRSARDGRFIAIAGVRDTGRKNRVWPAPPVPSAGIEYKAYILLAHNPDLILHMPETPVKVDVMISGHIHGGQIRTPFGLEFILRHDELPFKKVISGLHEVNGIKLFISKGIGCVFLPFRIFARPEINIIEIVAGSKED